jgi:hypothetical protein
MRMCCLIVLSNAFHCVPKLKHTKNSMSNTKNWAKAVFFWGYKVCDFPFSQLCKDRAKYSLIFWMMLESLIIIFLPM